MHGKDLLGVLISYGSALFCLHGFCLFLRELPEKRHMTTSAHILVYCLSLKRQLWGFVAKHGIDC